MFLKQEVFSCQWPVNNQNNHVSSKLRKSTRSAWLLLKINNREKLLLNSTYLYYKTVEMFSDILIEYRVYLDLLCFWLLFWVPLQRRICILKRQFLYISCKTPTCKDLVKKFSPLQFIFHSNLDIKFFCKLC